jgi:adenylate cyclase
VVNLFLRKGLAMPKRYLEWAEKNGPVHRVEIVDKVFIGRTCLGVEESKRIILCDPAVSRDHAIVSASGSRIQIADLSRNGVWINDARMPPGSSRDLKDGDVIGAARFRILVRCPESVSVGEDVERTHCGPVETIVTSLVADVRGFSGMSQRQDSSQVYALMKNIFEKLTTVVGDHKGTVKDYVGDAIHAFWNHGAATQKEDAVSACRAALRQLYVLKEMRLSGSAQGYPDHQDVLMGWGVATGKVTMAHYSSRSADLALVGDSTNLAFRLSGMANKELARPIVICSQTADLVRDTFTLFDLGLVTVRGRTGKEHVFGLS